MNDETDDVEIGFGQLDDEIVALYQDIDFQKILTATLDFINHQHDNGLVLPYFDFDDKSLWQKPKNLDIYITEPIEARELNLDARGKDYATNILSYPSDLPAEVLDILPALPLGELIICHDVLTKESDEQNKSFVHHLTHLVVHGILHLLGFDHELGEKQALQMEGFEIQILANLGIDNPYESF